MLEEGEHQLPVLIMLASYRPVHQFIHPSSERAILWHQTCGWAYELLDLAIYDAARGCLLIIRALRPTKWSCQHTCFLSMTFKYDSRFFDFGLLTLFLELPTSVLTRLGPGHPLLAFDHFHF